MKCFIAILFFGVALATSTSYAQSSQVSQTNELGEGYYVTIGVYAKSKEAYAKSYVEKVNDTGSSADYGLRVSKGWYYVYLLKTSNYREALASMREARKDEEFSEAWVYVHLDGATKIELADTDEEGSDQVNHNDTEVEEQEAEVEEQEIEKEEAMDQEAAEEVEEVTDEEVVEAEEVEEKTTDNNVSEPEEGEERVISSLADVDIIFNMINARNSKPVDGEIQIIDAERSKLLEVVKSGERIRLRDPNNGTGKLILITETFGFRKTQKELHYYNPMMDTSSSDVALGDAFMVNFDMIRYHKGDIATMFNVYFFKDAAVMQPESKYEVNQLLAMMKENEDYRIRIHGHTNGNSMGKIITREEDQQFFALDEDNVEGYGSAKKLSEERAKEIKDFLIDNGIPEDRMEIKAWGGKRMIHEKHTNKARYNVRVEIEILEE